MILLFSLFSYTLVAQNMAATFEMKFILEDAKGNRDSVILGYDTLANKIDALPLFGEDEITTPFDSVFEVRGVKYDNLYNSPITGKKRIMRVQAEQYTSFGFLQILIHTKNYPVKITYDAKKLNTKSNIGLRNTIFSKTSEVGLKESGWYNAKDWYCLASQNELSIDMTKKDGGNSWNTRLYEVQGKNTPQAIKCLNFQNFLGGPCKYLVNSDEVESIEPIKIYPNPVASTFYFDIDQSIIGEKLLYIEIFDLNGKILKKEILDKDIRQQVNVETLPNGFYFAKISDNQRSYFSSKFVKIE